MAESTQTQGAISELLDSGVSGTRDSFDEVFALVYDELKRLARHQLAAGWRQQTLDTTGLVHEAYLRLVGSADLSLRHRGYFFGAAARAMRRVLVDAARRRQSLKRGGGERDRTLDESILSVDGFAAELIGLDAALERLAVSFPRQADVVECRFFGGLTIEETAEALELSRRTVIRDWELARAWLYRELESDDRGRPTDEDCPRPPG